MEAQIFLSSGQQRDKSSFFEWATTKNVQEFGHFVGVKQFVLAPSKKFSEGVITKFEEATDFFFTTQKSEDDFEDCFMRCVFYRNLKGQAVSRAEL